MDLSGEMAVPEGERVRALVNVNVKDVVFHLRAEGERFRFIDINPAFTLATGLSREQVVGKLVDDVIPEPSRSVVLSKYRQAIAERRTVRWEEATDYPTGKKYGEVSITPVVDADGVCSSLIGTVHDVTATRRARSLNAAEQQVLEMVARGATLESTLATLALAIEEQVAPAIASVHLLSADGTHILWGAGPHLPEGYSRALEGALIGPTEGSCGTAAALRQTVIVTDTEVDPLWERYRDLARQFGLRACWSTPIFATEGRVVGTFALYYRAPRAPTEEDLDVIARAAHVAGIAIQRHELDDQLRALSAHVEAAREDERSGIAREIHDQLGQALTVLKMDLAWIARRATTPEGLTREALLAKLDDLSCMTDGIIDQVRRISAELRPGVLDDLGLVAALSWQAQEFERRTGILCAVHASVHDQDLSRELSTTVFRVLQEALTNVVRHAQAVAVDVCLKEEAGHLLLEVRDDGVGIRPEAARDRRSLGLLGVRERARRLGGTASIEALEPRGTVLRLRLPAATRAGR